MGKLLNARWEMFAQGVAKGNTLIGAYRAAGYKPTGSAATQLANRPEVRARVNELIEQWSDELSLSLERVLQELSRVAFSDIRRVVQWQGGKYQRIISKDENGAETVEFLQRQAPLVQLQDSGIIDAATAAAIQEVTQAKDGTIRVRMHPKLPALQQLATHFEGLSDGAKAKVISQVDPMRDPAKPLDFRRLAQEYSPQVTIEEPASVPVTDNSEPPL